MRVIIAVVSLASAAVLAAQQPPEGSSAELQAGPGVQATLWASEPEVTNPTNMTVDERGRVWVLEAVNYRRALRNQPDLRATGDRIVILEDTNRDGKGDTVKVFDQGEHIRAPLGIAVLGDKVYVSQSPNLTVYTKDANDQILSREVLLTGFGGVDHDHGLHAVVFGPDGKYYFNNGNTGVSVTDRSGRKVQSSSYENSPLNSPTAGYFQGVAMRMNGDGTNLEVLAQNFRNPYELTVDSFGNVFQTDNDDDGNAWTRLNYVMEGGNYGFFGPLHRTWNADRGGHFHNELPGVVPNILRLGPGSPCGLLIYEGQLLPERYRGQLIHAEAGKRIVAGYPLTNEGAGFGATIEEIVFGGSDTWFRPSDVAVAPDGSVFVADWYDPGVGGHNMGDQQGGRGRIYRIAPPGHTPLVPAVDLKTEQGLVAAFGSPNQSVRYLAHMAIAGQGAGAAPMLQRLWRGSDPILKARALWILGGLQTVGPLAIQEALRSPDARFRVLGLRVSRLTGADMLAVATPMLRDSSPQVRREIAILLRDTDPSRMIPPYLSTAQVTPAAAWLDAMVELISQHDGRDRWYLEAMAIAARGREDALYARLAPRLAQQTSVPMQQIVWALRPKTAIPDLVAAINSTARPISDRERALDALINMEWPEATEAVETFILSGSPAPELARLAFAGYSRQLFGLWPDARNGADLPRLVRKGLATTASQEAAVDLIGRLLDPQFLPDLRALARLDTADPAARAAAVSLLASTNDEQYVADMKLLGESGPAFVRVAAVRGVGALPNPDIAWAQGILLGEAPNDVRVEALRVMAGSTAGLGAVLDLAEKGQLPAEFRSLASSLTNSAGRGGRGGGGRGRGGFASVLARGAGAGPGAGGGAASPAARGAGAGAGRGAPTPDPALALLRERAAKLLPLPTSTSAPIPSIAALERNHRGNATAGRRVFEIDGACAACHSLGGAKKIGPDLSNIGLKYGKQAMLDHILRPSDAVGLEYVTSTIELRGGETVSGIVTETTPDRIVVRVNETEERRLRPSDILSRRQSGLSMMPEGLLSAMSLQQVSDLLEFLATRR